MRKLGIFLLVMSLVYLADAVLADFVPGFMERVLGNSFWMGVVMSCSSIAGITMDLLFAQLLKGTSVKRMMLVPIMGAAVFALLLLLARQWPILLILILGMVVWGIYYEFFGFAAQQYVVEVTPPHGRSSAWGVVEMVKCSAYMLGPLVGAKLATHGEATLLWGVVITLIIAYLMILVVKIPAKPVVVEVYELDLRKEMGHWRVLIAHVWPVLILSVTLGIMDAFFWTSGALLTDKLAQQSPWGGYFLSVYMLPSLFMGGIMAKLMISSGKKRKALYLIIMGGIVLSMLNVFQTVPWYLGVVLLSSTLMAAAWPLVDAVYTDLVARMGRERKHMIGLGNSTMSLAYVVGPFLAGSLGLFVGEAGSIAVWGGVIVAVGVLLLVVTPKKLRLPEQEIQTWEQ